MPKYVLSNDLIRGLIARVREPLRNMSPLRTGLLNDNFADAAIYVENRPIVHLVFIDFDVLGLFKQVKRAQSNEVCAHEIFDFNFDSNILIASRDPIN